MQIKPIKLLGVGLGSALEWYDFALYGFFVKIFASQYFPPSDPQANMLEAFSFFAIGFIVRPLGGFIFGRLGDKYGRIQCLKMTPILLTIPTVAIAFLPTYAEIGLWAPMLLLITRIIQGIFIGGEYAGNMVYMCESSINRRYFYGSIASCTGSLGIFLASLASSLVFELGTPEFAQQYGWRIAFLMSILLGIFAFLMRRNIKESHDYEQLKKEQKVSSSPIIDAFREEWKPSLIALSLLFLHATSFYAVITFMPTLIKDENAFIPGMALKYISLIIFARLIVMPMIGLLAEKIGGKIIMQVSSILFMTLSYSLFSVVYSGVVPDAIIALALFALMTTLNSGAVPGLLTEILRVRTRYTTFSFALNIGFGVFGGIAPMLSQYIIKNTGNAQNVALYLMFAGFVAFIGTFFVKSKFSYPALSTKTREVAGSMEKFEIKPT